jgi:xylose isomerase
MRSAAPVVYRFSFGPWNISEGADPFGPGTRTPFEHAKKFALYRELGFEGVQLHDDDAVPDIEGLAAETVMRRTREFGAMLKGEGLTAEFVAPRLWFSPATVDGAFTSNSAADRQSALNRARQSVDIARALGCKGLVLWLAREGTYVRESKNARLAYDRLLAAVNALLAHDPEIEIWIEPKPNEPTDQAYVPTIGHALAIAYVSDAPPRVKGLIESAHAFLAGLDPADEMAFALAHGKLASVHLNDQNGLKYDQDKNFGAANLRTAFNQVRVLEDAGYGRNGEFVGLDVKAMRTQAGSPATAHLRTSREIFLHLVEKVRTWDLEFERQCIEERDYEMLEARILKHLLGVA